MSRIGEILEYKRVSTDSGVQISDIQVDLGGGNVVTARHYQPPGDDSFPLVGEFCLCVPTGSEYVVVGFIDPQLTYAAAEGERVIFSRSALGTPEAILHLKADGTTEVNGSDFVAMAPLVAGELDRIKQELSDLKTAISAGFDAVGAAMAANGALGKAAFELAAAAIPGDPGDTASTRLKSE